MHSYDIPSSSKSIDEAVSVLSGGGVVAIPTDTLYGIAAAALDESAVQRVFDVKERGLSTPLPLFVSDVDDFHEFGLRVPDVARELAAAFWPGKLTHRCREVFPSTGYRHRRTRHSRT